MSKYWLDKFVDSMAEVESPERYFWWSGMAVISACVKKNVYLDKFRYLLYPNIYVIILSSKSGLRKGMPAMYATQLAESVGNIRVLEGSFTIEAMLKELSTQRTTEEGIIFDTAQALVIAPELKSLFSDTNNALGILTDLQNTHEHEKKWSKTTVGRSREELKNPCITFLGCSNEPYFEEVVKGADMEGGFIARTFIIHESKRRIINSLMKKPDLPYPRAELESYLKELSKVKGEFKINNSTRKLYDEWYRKISLLEYEDRTGTLERFGDQVLKAAMIISLSRDFSLVIDDEIMKLTIDKCEENFAGTRRISEGEGKAPISRFGGRFIDIIVKSKDYRISRSKLLQKAWPAASSVELDAIYNALGDGGTKLIQMEFDAKSGEFIYSMTHENASVFIGNGSLV